VKDDRFGAVLDERPKKRFEVTFWENAGLG
jgi:hypothetical protein